MNSMMVLCLWRLMSAYDARGAGLPRGFACSQSPPAAVPARDALHAASLAAAVLSLFDQEA